MTREEAIAVLQQRIDVIEDDQAYSQMSRGMYEDGYRNIEAFSMAINALQVGSPTTQPGADDLQKPAEWGWVSMGQCPHCGKNSYQLSEARCILRNELSIPNGFWAEPPAGGQDK